MQGIAVGVVGGDVGGDVELEVAAEVGAAGLGHAAAVELDGEGPGGVDRVVGAWWRCLALGRGEGARSLETYSASRLAVLIRTIGQDRDWDSCFSRRH